MVYYGMVKAFLDMKDSDYQGKPVTGMIIVEAFGPCGPSYIFQKLDPNGSM